ncbi:DUF4860 domain-containing protein [Clostridium sp. MCC353]|uniref:DUF4860 domain-containing protein n=1 Tax=Clostridium sp. MCC353 TaxID=2592646 RepID=UPI001C030CB5|nr:DUF4860 domain-containing protein [Clostridium sp. MCC353]MBT9777554.1 DUF4860 domain-containing protein [Clostridium sp. MCC353]
MGNKSVQKGQTMNTLFTMLLFLVFVLCALFTVLIGGKVYENITARMEENYTGSTALNYVANKVRQGDTYGGVRVKEVDGTSVLELSQEINGETYVTMIYYMDGSIRELFTDTQSGLGLSDGLEIIDCDGLELKQEGRLITVETTGEGGSRLILSLRSGGGRNE